MTSLFATPCSHAEQKFSLLPLPLQFFSHFVSLFFSVCLSSFYRSARFISRTLILFFPSSFSLSLPFLSRYFFLSLHREIIIALETVVDQVERCRWRLYRRKVGRLLRGVLELSLSSAVQFSFNFRSLHTIFLYYILRMTEKMKIELLNLTCPFPVLIIAIYTYT